MSGRLRITAGNVEKYFFLEPFGLEKTAIIFNCPIDEYNDWLFQDASCAHKDHIAKTWLLWERSTGSIAAYISLVMDVIKLSFTTTTDGHSSPPCSSPQKPIHSR